MDEHAPKKRRLNPPTALHKPFKSPFRASAGPTTISSSPPPTVRRNYNSYSATAPQAASSPLAPRSTNLSFNRSLNHQQPRRPLAPALLNAQRSHTALLTRVRAQRSELDTLKQAAKIEQNNQDAELQRLIGIWRCAGQSAAEEIFGTVKDKVNKMGGVVAWRRKEQERKERLEEWAKEGEEGSEEGEEDGSEESEGDIEEVEGRARRREEREMIREAKEARREQRRIARAEMAELEGEKVAKVVAEEFPEDETFTMDMMLKEMKVDLDMIGFDAGAQKWVD